MSENLNSLAEGEAAPEEDYYFSEGGFLFDPRTGLSYTLNGTGSFIFKLLRRGESEEGILQKLTEVFDVERWRAEEDLRDFIQQVRDFGLLT